MAKILFSAYAVFLISSMGFAVTLVGEPKEAEKIVKAPENDPPYHF
jgi:hypothetical protein